MDASLAEWPDVQPLKLNLTNSLHSGYLPSVGRFTNYNMLYFCELLLYSSRLATKRRLFGLSLVASRDVVGKSVRNPGGRRQMRGTQRGSSQSSGDGRRGRRQRADLAAYDRRR